MDGKEEPNTILDSGIKRAQLFLEKRGEFVPFALTLNMQGKIDTQYAYESETAPTKRILKLLTESLKNGAKKGQFRAVGVVLDGKVQVNGSNSKTDAIVIQLEHKNADPVNICLPYKKLPNGKFEYFELVGSTRTPEYFKRPTKKLPASPTT